MLSVMREHATSWFIKIILGAIVIVFVLWGVGNFGDEQRNRVATVNGEPITVDAYRTAYNNLLQRYSDMYGGNLNDEMLKMLNLDQQALNSLIDETLLRQEAEAMSFQISDGELADAIAGIEAFQNDAGRFDTRRYQAVLSANRLTPEEFEQMQRRSMLSAKLRSLIMDSVKVSDDEVRQWYRWQNAAVQIDYAHFDPAGYEVDLTDEAVREYYEAHPDQYQTQPQVKAQYLRFAAEDYTDQVTVTDEEIEVYYNSHQSEFPDPETVSARHILIKTSPDDDEATIEEKRERAEEILEKARAGEDFAELARQYSEGPTREKGGDLGTFERGRMAKPFSDKAFSMEPGEISEPVRTQFGWHIIKVENKTPESTKPLEVVRDDIRDTLALERGLSLAYDAADAAYYSVAPGDGLTEVSAATSADLQTTDFFTRSGPTGDDAIVNPRRIASAAFSLAENEISDITKIGDAYYLIEVIEKREATLDEFENVADRVRADFRRERQQELARADAEAFLASLTESPAEAPEPDGEAAFDAEGEAEPAESEPTETATASGEEASESPAEEDEAADTPEFPEFQRSEPFKRNEAIPGIGREQAIAQAAFGLSADNPYPDAPLKARNGWYVIRFAERKYPEREDFDKEAESVRQQLLQRKQYQTFNAWLDQVKAQSEIREMLN